MENEQRLHTESDFAKAKHAVSTHMRTHPLPYLLIGAGILGAYIGISRRQKGHPRVLFAEENLSAPHVRTASKTHHAASSQPTESSEHRERKNKPRSQKSDCTPNANEGAARAHTGNGENREREHKMKAWAEMRRQSFAQTRQRLAQNRVELTKKYAEEYQETPLRFGLFSAILGGLIGILVPLSLRERNLWRPLGQRFWLQAQHWSAQELQKWDAAIDAHVESSAAE